MKELNEYFYLKKNYIQILSPRTNFFVSAYTYNATFA